MLKDVGKRPFITMGFTAFVLMVPLAITSTNGWIRRLGGKNWNRLHKLIYVSAAAGCIHFYWLVKKDVRRPVLYATILAILLFYRVLAKFIQSWSAGRKQVARTMRPLPSRDRVAS
jgi:sulfoxide reductase heme-binding subunit YedZ